MGELLEQQGEKSSQDSLPHHRANVTYSSGGCCHGWPLSKAGSDLVGSRFFTVGNQEPVISGRLLKEIEGFLRMVTEEDSACGAV